MTSISNAGTVNFLARLLLWTSYLCCVRKKAGCKENIVVWIFNLQIPNGGDLATAMPL